MKKRELLLRATAVTIPLIIMAVIFVFSAQPAKESSNTSGGIAVFFAKLFDHFEKLSASQQLVKINAWQFVVRKTAHFTIYSLLGTSVANAANIFKKPLLLSPIIPMLYSITDEVHQYFVEGRSCELRDILLDTGGGVFGVLVYMFILYIIKRRKTNGRKI